MNSFARLLEQQPLIFVHMLSALGSLLVGAAALARRKGTSSHRAIGWIWVLLMGSTAATSAFMRDLGLPNVFGFTPIHLLTLTVGVLLPGAVIAARRGNIKVHRQSMRGIYIGGCIVAGLFTLLPGRFLGQQVWPALATLVM
jgi:uncharacterized membrane protein